MLHSGAPYPILLVEGSVEMTARAGNHGLTRHDAAAGEASVMDIHGLMLELAEVLVKCDGGRVRIWFCRICCWLRSDCIWVAIEDDEGAPGAIPAVCACCCKCCSCAVFC